MTKPSFLDEVLGRIKAKHPEVTKDEIVARVEWLVKHDYIRRFVDIYGQTRYVNTGKNTSNAARDMAEDPIDLGNADSD
jgi:hypothetical protein